MVRKRVRFLPCSRNSGEVSETLTVTIPSVTLTALSVTASVTVYLKSSVIDLSWIGSSCATRRKRFVVGFSAHNTTNCTSLSPRKRSPRIIFDEFFFFFFLNEF